MFNMKKIKFIRDRIYWFYQKIRYGYSDRDFWSLDQTLTKFILPRLRYFRNMNKVGVPTSVYSNYDLNVDIDSDHDKAELYWNEILDKMIRSFELLEDEDLDSPFVLEEEHGIISLDKENEFTKIETFGMNYDKKIAEKRDLEVQAGLKLFIEYYSNLWD